MEVLKKIMNINIFMQMKALTNLTFSIKYGIIYNVIDGTLF